MAQDIQIIIEGPEAQNRAALLEQIIYDHFGVKPIRSMTEPAKPDPEKKWLDPAVCATIGAGAAAIGVILKIPETVLKVMDIMDRIRKKKDLDRVIAAEKQERQTQPDTNAKIAYPDGTMEDLAKADANQILDRTQKR